MLQAQLQSLQHHRCFKDISVIHFSIRNKKLALQKIQNKRNTKEDRRQPLLNSLVSKSINYGIMAIVQKDVQTDVPTNSPIGKGRRILDLQLHQRRNDKVIECVYKNEHLSYCIDITKNLFFFTNASTNKRIV